MTRLSRHLRALDGRHHGPGGDVFAAEELRPVARFRFAEAWYRMGRTRVGLGRASFAVPAPAHLLPASFGSSGDLLLPGLRVVGRVEEPE